MALSTSGGLACARQFQNSVVPHLRSCITSIESVLDIVHQQQDQYGLSRQHRSIRIAITDASNQAFAAESAAVIILNEMNSYYESLIRQQSTMRWQIDRQTAELNEKRSSLHAEKAALEYSQRQMDVTHSEMESNQKKLDDLHVKMEKYEDNKSTGIALMILGVLFPPVLIGGGIMVAVSKSDLAKAKREAEYSETHLKEATRRYEACSKTVWDLETRVRQLAYDIQDAEWSLDNINRETSRVYSLLQNMADVQPSFNRATTKLGEIAACANALEVSTRHIVLLESLMDSVEAIAEKMSQLSGRSGNEKQYLLHKKDIAPITRRLNENRSKFRPISYYGNFDQWT